MKHHVACGVLIMLLSLLPGTALLAGAQQEGGDPSYSHLTFDEVARTGHEVNYEEVADAYGGPMSRAPVVSVKAHPEVIWVRPDMGIGMVANPVAFGVNFLPVPIPWRKVERTLRRGYLPIVTSRVREGDLSYEQEVYATLLDEGEVRTGHEKQVVIVRMSVLNTDPSECRGGVLWGFIPAEVSTSSEGSPYKLFGEYTLFDVTGSLPSVPAKPLERVDDVLRDGPAFLGVHQEGPGVRATRYDKVLKWEMDLLPGQKKSVVLKISTNKQGFTDSEMDRVRKLDYYTALDRRVASLEAVLARGMKIQVPEEIVNNIYKAQILYNQTQMVQAADRDYYVPVQGSVGFWPWEQMKQLVALDAFGYHQDVQRSLGYFLKRQGKRPPKDMKAKSYAGVFSSSGMFEESGWQRDPESTIYGYIAARTAEKEQDFPDWVSNTGASLRAFGEHYFYTRDKNWLEAVAPAMVKACDWIITMRESTKVRDAQGQKVLYYGLMPAGQPYDPAVTQKPDYYVGISDSYTYQGLHRIAQALADIGHPEGTRLLKEAESYRQDILEVMRRVRKTGPDMPPYPEHLYGPEGWASGDSGAICLVDTGLLDPRDPAFTQLEDYMKRHFNYGVLGLSERMKIDDSVVAGSYYMVTSEDIYHYGWVVRGEVEKALLTFYSTLAFGVDKDTLGAVERFSLYDRRYAPFFIDSSGGMRICDMIRRTLFLERDSELRLLAAVPRRWLEAGKKIVVENAPTYFGTMNLKVESQVEQQNIVADLDLQVERAGQLPKIRLRLPHPDRLSMKQVTVNGKPWPNYDAAAETINLMPTQKSYHVVAQF